MRVIRNNTAQVKASLERAFAKTAVDYADRMQTVITDPRQWPAGFGTTHRRNGQTVVGSFRNIEDLGNLLRSQQFSVSGFLARYQWDGNGQTPVVLVHEGYTTKTGKRIPPRRWTIQALQEIDLSGRFVSHFRDDISSVLSGGAS